jgi:NADH:ubiquinone oxidoreductase subunit 5 (subunit L)/multisubunit Na+/H+ antiporter MnhA subunit
MNWPILSVVTFLPLLGALLVAFLVHGNERLARGTARWVALWATLVTFAISLVMVWRFDAGSPEFQYVEKYNWLGIASYGRRRNFAALRDPHDRVDADLHSRQLDGDPDAREGIHDRLPRA